ncbi:unnamed protein product [Schistosoma curassoni]|uniref:Uncharacterized protein n=1 Tax=Schistosoma curassoni TaxID=6186 RepID=A0A183JMF7_9TREM|nr:unnamed protein product [Schistosoma curassoni]
MKIKLFLIIIIITIIVIGPGSQFNPTSILIIQLNNMNKA